MNHKKIHEFMLDHGSQWIQWKRNPPTASNTGGVWEPQIRSAHSILVALLKIHETSLNDESLRTFLAKVEAIVITRPITSESFSDVHSPVPFCPMQLLTMKSRVVIPPQGEFQKEGIYFRKQWRHVQHLANKFWSRSKKEVYATLQVCHKWNKIVRNFKVGDIVLLREETSRNKWPMGRVIAIQEGNDGFVRRVNMVVGTNASKTFGTGILERPANKLVLLVESEDENNIEQ